jgi:uncharacterized membrane protein YdjX (TVP38/TMEM64 family)
MGSGRLRRFAPVALALAGFLALLAAASVLPVQDWISALAVRLAGYGLLGMAAFLVLQVAGTMAMVPSSLFAFAAGLMFDRSGLVLVWCGMMATAWLSFALARSFLARRARQLMEKRRLTRAIADIIEDEGWIIVLLVRLSGIVPFGVQNYLFGATRIGVGPFLLATTVGVIPSILVAGSAGIAAGSALSGQSDPMRMAILGLSVVAGLVLLAVTAHRLRARLAAAEQGAGRSL